MLEAVSELSPRMASLGDAVHSLSAHSRMARVLKLDFCAASVLCSLQIFLGRITDGLSSTDWQETMGACRALITNGPRDKCGAAQTLDAVLERLRQLCERHCDSVTASRTARLPVGAGARGPGGSDTPESTLSPLTESLVLGPLNARGATGRIPGDHKGAVERRDGGTRLAG